jgi:hypothetical protein
LNARHSTGFINAILEVAEVQADSYAAKGLAQLPPEVFMAALKRLEEEAKVMREIRIEQYPALTEADIRYCEMEEIPLAEFQASKVKEQQENPLDVDGECPT